VADKATHRAQKRAEKQKKTRAEAQARRARQQTQAGPTLDPRARGWKLGEAWITEGWDEPGATVFGAFTRAGPGGAHAVAIVEVDLAAKGLILAETLMAGSEGAATSAVVAKAGERGLQTCPPERIVRLAAEGRSRAAMASRPVPEGLPAVMHLFGELEPEAGDDLFRGLASAAGPTGPGLLDRLTGWFKRS
jgi:hypothetical protein